nr:antitoxin MazE family protein [Sphingomonas sp. CROZ-RG-20F-R02-07]
MLHVTKRIGVIPVPAPVTERVRKRRDVLRAAGLRPIQIWVPDTRRPGFADECRRQALVVAAADAADHDLDAFLDAALVDLDPQGEA